MFDLASFALPVVMLFAPPAFGSILVILASKLKLRNNDNKGFGIIFGLGALLLGFWLVEVLAIFFGSS